MMTSGSMGTLTRMVAGNAMATPHGVASAVSGHGPAVKITATASVAN